MEDHTNYIISKDFKIEVGYEDDVIYLRLLSVDDSKDSMSAEFGKDEFKSFLEMLTEWFNSLEAE